MLQLAPNWQQLTPELLMGSPAPSGFEKIATQPLLIVEERDERFREGSAGGWQTQKSP